MIVVRYGIKPSESMAMVRVKNNQSMTSARRGAKRSVRRAFTLLEIIVVVTIIALLATLIAPRLLGQIGKTKTRIAKHSAATIAEQVGLYCADNGKSGPGQEFDLTVLTQGTSPYLEAKDLLDPWGNPFMILVPGEVHPSSYDIVSYGADGQKGGEGENSDVTN